MTGRKQDKNRIIVFGNETGGTGKSTTAMPVLAVSLEKSYRVSVIDLDPRKCRMSRRAMS